MSSVFIGGSRKVSRLNAHVCARLDPMILNELDILVGDANGADKAVQAFCRFLTLKTREDLRRLLAEAEPEVRRRVTETISEHAPELMQPSIFKLA